MQPWEAAPQHSISQSLLLPLECAQRIGEAFVSAHYIVDNGLHQSKIFVSETMHFSGKIHNSVVVNHVICLF